MSASFLDSWVYFIRPVNHPGPVKIGVSWNPRERLRVYLKIAPWPLEIATQIEGGPILERRFHAAFRRYQSHLEWFHPNAELTATIDAIRAGTFDIETLPPPRKLPDLRIVSDRKRAA